MTTNIHKSTGKTTKAVYAIETTTSTLASLSSRREDAPASSVRQDNRNVSSLAKQKKKHLERIGVTKRKLRALVIDGSVEWLAIRVELRKHEENQGEND